MAGIFLQDDSDEDAVAEVKKKSVESHWAEQHEDHPICKKGAEVRVARENLMHQLRYSQIGKVIGHVDGEVCVRLDQVMAPVVMPAEILVSNKGAPEFKPLKTLLRTSHQVKKDLLKVIGVFDPTVEQVEVLTTQEKRLSDAELDTFLHCCRWALDLDEEKDLQIAPSKLVGLLLDGHLGIEGSQGAEDPEAHQKRLRVFRYMHKVSKVMLIPIRGEGPPQHFTLLVLRKGEEQCLRYYDSLIRLHEDCLSNAHHVLDILGIKAGITHQYNQSRQVEVECGFFTCHYSEDEMRGFRNGQGQIKWPNQGRITDVRNYIVKVSSSLEGYRQI